MNILAIDFGTKRLGIAVGNIETGIAFPREGIENNSFPLIRRSEGVSVFFEVLTLCQQEKIEKILVGLPLMPRGTDSKETENARQFAEDLEDFLLENNCDIPVDYTDERFSSKSAQQAAQAAGKTQKQSRGNLDSAAAAIFLQQYLDGC